MRIYKLYGGGIGSSGAGGRASVGIVRNGKIKSIKWSSTLDGSADNASVQFELSLQATCFVGNNDTVGPIDEIAHYVNSGAAGTTTAQVNQQTSDLNFPVALGEKLYLHQYAPGGATGYATCFVYVEE